MIIPICINFYAISFGICQINSFTYIMISCSVKFYLLFYTVS